jgi:MFS family permease
MRGPKLGAAIGLAEEVRKLYTMAATCIRGATLVNAFTAAASNSMISARRRLPLVLLGNAILRVANGATGVLVGLYLARLAGLGGGATAALAGTLGAVVFAAELLGAIPMGLTSDAVAPRRLMTAGALLGAIATQLFGMTGSTTVFFLSRTIEGFGASAATPSLLAHLTDVTEGDPPLRARVMSYFELSLLAGLALGSVLASQLWRWFDTRAFAAVAVCYLASAAMLYIGAAESRAHGFENALAGFRRALSDPSLRRLAPIWLCVNTLVGLWLGPTLTFLLTDRSLLGGSQVLAGMLADEPQQVGWVMFGYAMIFGAGVTAWSVVLPRMNVVRALRISLIAMLGACLGLYLLNHSTPATRLPIMMATAGCIMIESGFTPAALALLAGSVGSQAGRGAAMGIYSLLLSLGAIAGSLLAGWLGQMYAVDGLTFGTTAMAVVAIVLAGRLRA